MKVRNVSYWTLDNQCVAHLTRFVLNVTICCCFFLARIPLNVTLLRCLSRSPSLRVHAPLPPPLAFTIIFRSLQGPGLALIIVSMTMRHAQCISASSDKQWSFTKTRRSLRQLVKSMLRVSRLIKPSSLSSDTVSIVARRLSTARWLEWNAHQSESWAGLMIPCAAY